MDFPPLVLYTAQRTPRLSLVMVHVSLCFTPAEASWSGKPAFHLILSSTGSKRLAGFWTVYAGPPPTPTEKRGSYLAQICQTLRWRISDYWSTATRERHGRRKRHQTHAPAWTASTTLALTQEHGMVLLHHLFHVEANSWQWAFGFDLQRARVGIRYLLRS